MYIDIYIYIQCKREFENTFPAWGSSRNVVFAGFFCTPFFAEGLRIEDAGFCTPFFAEGLRIEDAGFFTAFRAEGLRVDDAGLRIVFWGMATYRYNERAFPVGVSFELLQKKIQAWYLKYCAKFAGAWFNVQHQSLAA